MFKCKYKIIPEFRNCKRIRQQQFFSNKSNHKEYQKWLSFAHCLSKHDSIPYFRYICIMLSTSLFFPFDLCFLRLICVFLCVCVCVRACILTFRNTKTKQIMHSKKMTAYKIILLGTSSGHTSAFSSCFFHDRIENQSQRIRAILYAVLHSILIRKLLYFSISASE